MSRPRMIALLPKVLRGIHLGSPYTVHGTFTASLRLISDRSLPVHCDGEIFATAADDVRDLTVRMERGALRLAGG